MNCRLWKCATLAACTAMMILLIPGTPLMALEELQVDFGVEALRGEIHGHVQVPSGGEPGTTSSHRPTLRELGIDDTGPGDFWVNVSHDPHGLYLGGRLIHLGSDSTLDRTLVSHGVTFPAGSRLDAEVKFDWYRMGYRYHLPLDWGAHTIDLYPSIGATFLDFRYRLESRGLGDTDRSYSKVGSQLGLGANCPIKGNLSLFGQVFAPIPVPHWPSILSTQAGLRYCFFERDDLCIAGLAGLDYDWVSYKDGQRVPNDIKADVGPMGFIALEVTF